MKYAEKFYFNITFGLDNKLTEKEVNSHIVKSLKKEINRLYEDNIRLYEKNASNEALLRIKDNTIAMISGWEQGDDSENEELP